MSKPNFAPLKLFITGPTYIRQDVKEAALLPEFGHRDSENDLRFGPIRENLRKLAGAGDMYEPILLLGSGSTGMEASVRSLVDEDETILNVSVGAFGDMYYNIAASNEKKAENLKFDYGQAIDMDVLEAKLKEMKPDVVSFTHNETSTGVVNDMKAVCALIRKYGAMPLVDGVSIFGGADLDLANSGAAMYATATQKAMGLPAGFGVAFISKEAEEKAEKVTNKGHHHDITKHLGRARKNQTLTTPNCTLANQMWFQLDRIVNEEGIENRFARHIEMRGMVEKWVAGLDGFEMFAPEGFRSPTVSTVVCPEGVTVAQLKKGVKEALRGEGYLMDPGYGKLNTALEDAGRPLVIRVGHMGDIMPDMLAEYLGKLEVELKKL
ncbi:MULTISPECIES: aminotransferase class V-fold PLP-dependent enzyme [unclassified Pseudodesulfovibrio]|uniref:pyridoxal-phosphate-dependent aminotransferase family protein n=1 Tax=unclassified Pseudodesulfovibrio TaxID=2661612 RepID=UPI000FEBB6B3|nr:MULTISPECIES: aminotransferase class V-fold PLP-dependent enzyme [unclassified Pseudodesulfovibrio]MCJ2166211.1 aminotransferase class V-fold PLP-dependent enzyme [Pseudodesulfovibrio sp. S3-i]RWU02301.1 alanine--glyoxylate aminotransferase family protein [Pseudodesulfovibrio sp. S3]